MIVSSFSEMEGPSRRSDAKFDVWHRVATPLSVSDASRSVGTLVQQSADLHRQVGDTHRKLATHLHQMHTAMKPMEVFFGGLLMFGVGVLVAMLAWTVFFMAEGSGAWTVIPLLTPVLAMGAVGWWMEKTSATG